MTRVHAVIPAAGRGVRFGSGQNKIFEKLNGRPIIEWTVEALKGAADRVTVMAGAEDLDQLNQMVARDNVRIAIGGQTRQESVWHGLQTVEGGDDTIVLVHDAARPLVSSDLIRRCIDSVLKNGSGVAALPVVDALKRVDGNTGHGATVHADLSREGVWAVQTPQAFNLGELRRAHTLARDDGYVGLDESSLVQRLPNTKVHLVYGDRRNVKITTADDLVFASRQAGSQRAAEMRVGLGYDIHRLIEGRALWLGGIEIPSELGLDGHSDADVVLHAICDSLLGAAGLSDIGHLFPNTDPQFRGISSLTLLGRVREALEERGWDVGNVDAMVIAERPRIAPYVSAMRSAIAEALQISAECTSVKATTNEGIGSLGSGDGIACHATATICRSR